MTSLLPQSKSWKIQKVGIAMAVFRPNPFTFEIQLKSIQDQIFTNWVCVITSDSSLEEIFAHPRISPFKKDPRFKWFENPLRLGHKRNFERAAQLVLQENVDAVAFSDQDDLWYSNKLTTSIDQLEKIGRLSLVHCDMNLLINEESQPTSETAWQIERRGIHHSQLIHLLVRNIVAGCGMLIDAELIRRFPTIPEEAEFHDHWYALVGAAHGGISPIQQPLYAYRQHSENVIGVTPYQKFFKLPDMLKATNVFQYCRDRWKKSHKLALGAQKAKLPFTPIIQITLISKWDRGIGLLLFALKTRFSDPALSRACLARAVGKFLSR